MIKQKLLFGFLLLTLSSLSHGQNKLMILKTNNNVVSIRDGGNYKKDYWTISPETNPDIYETFSTDGKPYKVSFITDIDSISFTVEENKKYSFIIKKGDSICNTQIVAKKFNDKFSSSELLTDFDILVKSLKEAHTGLYWYTTKIQFDSICSIQRLKIKDSLNTLEFYNIVVPVVVATREGHCQIFPSNEAEANLKSHTKFLPFFVKFLDNKLYIVNDFENQKTKGLIIKKINGEPIESVNSNLFSLISADGYNTSLKYAWLDGIFFSKYYNYYYKPQENFNLELLNPKTNSIEVFKISATIFERLKQIEENAKPQKKETEYASLEYFEKTSTGILSLNTFSGDRMPNEFHKLIDSLLSKIRVKKLKNLIIDIRKNEGGVEGYEDYVFSYLTNQPYRKYKYVELSAFSYSFYQYTNLSTKEKQTRFEEMLKDEHYLETDGRILRKAGILTPEKPRQNAFKGNIFLLTSGLTYSGGAEFASIIKGHRKATFIGQEIGGGYYGNTSGFELKLTLPISKIYLNIPLLKFVVDVKGNIPFGHGVIPDYKIEPTIDQYLNGYDKEMELAKKMTEKK